MRFHSERRDIPPDLVRKAAAVGPSLLRWLEAAYPTDEEQAELERRRSRLRSQLPLRWHLERTR
jgi:hypothetical protein